MNSPVSRSYRIHGFAERAGVTVKALRHSDRLGLLKPRRTDAGYRLYSENDLDRVERITALKFLGIPLKQIRSVLDRPGLALPEALRLQRGVLEQRQGVLGRAIRAIENAEDALRSGSAAESAAWQRIIEGIAVHNDVEFMKRYYSEKRWLKRSGHYDEWPSREFENLFREIGTALDEHPAGERARALAERWKKPLNPKATGDPEVQASALAAWNDRADWPTAMRARAVVVRMSEL